MNVMATQGIVSIVSDGKVIIKLITGSNGSEANKLKEQLEKSWPLDINKAYEIALNFEFGSTDSLVAMDKDNIIFHGEGNIGDRYRDTFNDPRFNPRWEYGLADEIEILQV